MTSGVLAFGVFATAGAAAFPDHPARGPKPAKLNGKAAFLDESVPGHPWVAKQIKSPPPMKGEAIAAPVFPAAASADVALSAPGLAAAAATSDSGADAVSGLVQAGSTPVWVGPSPHAGKAAAASVDAAGASQASAPASVRITVIDHRKVQAAKVSGTIVTVARADGKSAEGSVRVAVDYSKFEQAFGGDYAGRLELVALPQCALTTPGVAACEKATPVQFTNDTAGKRLIADVNLPATAPQASAAAVSAAKAPAAMVLAATSTFSSSGGTYSASSLSASNQWSVSSNTGSFSYSYPITVPPALGGSAPSVELNYDSGSVDGRTAVENSQPSWIGEGWDYTPGYIERTTVPCAKAKPTAYPTSTDNCFVRNAAGALLPAFTLSWGAHGGQLVHDDSDSTGTVFKLPVDDGTRVTLMTGSLSKTLDGVWNGEYFRIQSPNGSVAFFGPEAMPPDLNNGAWGNSVNMGAALTEPLFNNPNDSACQNPTTVTTAVAIDACDTAYRWMLQYSVDPHGNLTQYVYAPEENSYSHGTALTAASYDRSNVLTEIDYGWKAADAVAGRNPAAKVTFTAANRCIMPGAPYAVGSDPGCNLTTTDWPPGMMDTPTDEVCVNRATCNSTGQLSPSFWTKDRLVAIDTQVAVDGAYQNVDHYDFFHSFPTTDNPSWSGLWLAAIRRCAASVVSGGACPQAVNGVANQQVLPDVQFTGVALPQRVPGVKSGTATSLPSYLRYRINTIYDELGASTTVKYDDPTLNTQTNTSNFAPLGCTMPPSSESPAVQPDWHNHQLCYPEYWTPQGLTDPIQDWFHKYVATSVDAVDNTGTTADVLTSYGYDTSAGAAWHSNDSELLADNTYRTYDVYRGFANVTTTVGRTTGTGADINHPQTQSISYYLRGMDQDPDLAAAKAGACNDTDCPKIFVHDSQNVQTQDDIAFTGEVLETKQVKTADAAGAGGAVWTDAINRPWKSDPMASHKRTAPLPAQRSRQLGVAETVTTVPLAPGGSASTRTTTVDTYHDQADGGRIVYSDALAPSPADGTPELCTATQYASSSSSPWMLTYADQSTVTTGPCLASAGPIYAGGILSPAASGGTVVSGARTWYDNTGSTFSGTSLSVGDANRVEALSGPAGSAGTYVTRSTAAFDAYGRGIQTGDGAGNATKTSYTPINPAQTSMELPASSAVTNPKGWVTTTVLDSKRQLPTDVTDPNGRVTHADYDGLGRVLAVWQPDHPKTAYPGAPTAYPSTPNQKYSYTVNGYVPCSGTTCPSTPPSVVESDALREDNSYGPSFTLLDSLGRTRQTQTSPVSQDNGRIVTDTSYDSTGRVNVSTGTYYDKDNVPSGNLWTVDTQAPLQTQKYYDGYGRPTAVLTLSGATELWRTTTSYPGADRTDVAPPTGGQRTSTVTDARGNTVELYTYHGADTAAYPWGTTDADKVDITHYSYDAAGHQAQVKDAAGNTWTTVYDLLGRKTQFSDPDAGTTYYTSYDANDNLTGTTDARGTSLYYAIDTSLNRKTDIYQGTSTAGTLLAHWDYDSLDKGQLTDSISYSTSGAPYKSTVTGYDQAYRPLGATVSIPSADGNGALGGSYTTTNHYTPITGLLSAVDLPTGGDLNADTVNNGYNLNGLQIASSDSFGTLLSDSGYTPFGETQRRTLGDYPNEVVQDTIYDPATRRVSNTTVSQLAWNSPIDSTAYTYSPAGQITATVDQQSTATSLDLNTGIVSTSQAVDAQCFTYDYASRLTQAWTDTGGASGTIFGSMSITSGGSGVPNPYGKPTNGGLGGCVNTAPKAGNIGGPAPYWETFGYDNPTGNRTSETEHDNTGATTAAHSYTYGTAGTQPHTLTQETTTGTGAGTNNYSFDAAGNMKKRSLGTQPTQNLNFDPQGRLSTDTDNASVNATYVYDAGGNQLIRRDSTGTTLYLGATELHMTGSRVTGDRYFSYSGAPEIVETGGATPTITYEAANSQNTSNTTIAASPPTDNNGDVESDKAVTARRAYTPFNTPRGTANNTATWNQTFPDDHTFLGKTTDSTTGLVDVGARKYDPTTGQFISIDPVFESANPQAMGGYTYAGDDPVSASDPTGLDPGGQNCVTPAGLPTKCDASGAPTASNSTCYSTLPGCPGYVPPASTPKTKTAPKVVQVSPHVKAAADASNAPELLAAWQWITERNGQPKNDGDEWGDWHAICNNSPFVNLCVGDASRMSTEYFGNAANSGDPGMFASGASIIVSSSGMARSLLDPSSMVGATVDEVRAMVPPNWVEQAMRKGVGIRFGTPATRNAPVGGKGFVEFSEGSETAVNPLESAGPFIRLSVGGFGWRVAGAGNPTTGDAAIQINGTGSPGPGLAGATDLDPSAPLPDGSDPLSDGGAGPDVAP